MKKTRFDSALLYFERLWWAIGVLGFLFLGFCLLWMVLDLFVGSTWASIIVHGLWINIVVLIFSFWVAGCMRKNRQESDDD